MLVKALTSFCGKVNMGCGEVGEISDLAVAKDLLRAGYIEEVKTKPETKPEVEKKPAKTSKSRAKRNTPKGG